MIEKKSAFLQLLIHSYEKKIFILYSGQIRTASLFALQQIVVYSRAPYLGQVFVNCSHTYKESLKEHTLHEFTDVEYRIRITTRCNHRLYKLTQLNSLHYLACEFSVLCLQI